MSVIFINPYIAFPPGGLALPNIGDPFQGGYYAGLISHTANGVATHALIVAPAATGATGTGYPVTTNLQLKTVATSTVNAGSAFDGAANTVAMAEAGINDHPAAKFCVDLAIEGYTDWYLPASLELDIAYFNLKPTTTANAGGRGLNIYAVPPRTETWSASVPARTSASLFISGGSEAFASGVHWASTHQGASLAWRMIFNTGDLQGSSSKTSSFGVRAFRRVAL